MFFEAIDLHRHVPDRE